MDSTQYKRNRLDELRRYFIFMKERFGLIGSSFMITLFVLAHYGLVYIKSDLVIETHLLFAVILGSIIFFVKLRLYDEIKDYEVDLIQNPDRPLPRGLVTRDELKEGIEKRIMIESILFYGAGIEAFSSILLAIAYSLLMYKEFFIGKYIRPHLTTYATSHTIVTFFLSLAIFSAFTQSFIWNLDGEYIFFSLMSWLLFNIFELGRKMYQPFEERDQVESYSKVWTRPGATLLVLIHASLIQWLIHKIEFFKDPLFLMIFRIPVAILLLVSLLYLLLKKSVTANLYRNYSTVFILLNYVIILFFLAKAALN